MAAISTGFSISVVPGATGFTVGGSGWGGAGGTPTTFAATLGCGCDSAWRSLHAASAIDASAAKAATSNLADEFMGAPCPGDEIPR
jgi:hypothetical protein